MQLYFRALFFQSIIIRLGEYKIKYGSVLKIRLVRRLILLSVTIINNVSVEKREKYTIVGSQKSGSWVFNALMG